MSEIKNIIDSVIKGNSMSLYNNFLKILFDFLERLTIAALIFFGYVKTNSPILLCLFIVVVILLFMQIVFSLKSLMKDENFRANNSILRRIMVSLLYAVFAITIFQGMWEIITALTKMHIK